MLMMGNCVYRSVVRGRWFTFVGGELPLTKRGEGAEGGREKGGREKGEVGIAFLHSLDVGYPVFGISVFFEGSWGYEYET